MARRYGKRGPGETGWDMLEEPIHKALIAEGGYAATEEDRQRVVGAGPNLEQKGNKYGWGFGCAFLGLFPVAMIATSGPNPEISQAGLIAVAIYGVFVLYLGVRFLLSIMRKSAVDQQNKVIDRRYEKKRTSESNVLIEQAKTGNFDGFDRVPQARRVAQGFYAEQEIGRELEANLPPEVEIAHDIDVVARDATEAALIDLTSNVDPGNLFYDLMRKALAGRQTANIDYLISTANGVIVADSKHWTGRLQLDNQGMFSAGPNHRGNQYRQKAAKTLAYLANQVHGGNVAMALIIVDGGTVTGGHLQTVVDGTTVVAIDRRNAVDFIRNFHYQGAPDQLVPLATVFRSSPNLHN